MTQDEAFKTWWYQEGSQAPLPYHDFEEHVMRMCEIAWANGAFKEREACAKLCESLPMQQEIDVRDQCAAAIRARGQA